MMYNIQNMKVNVGKTVSISTVDWYGRASHVIFFNGCPLRCLWCQNHKLLDYERFVDIGDIEKSIADSERFISAVVFSGGEPTMQRCELIHLARFVKKRGLLVGIQTNGYFPDVLKELAKNKLVDKIFLDIKADPLDQEKYSRITGNIYGTHRIAESLQISYAVPNIVEARTTIFRSLNYAVEIARYLAEHDYNGTYLIQQGVPWNALDKKMRKEDILTREEIISIAKNINVYIGLKGIKIRTREKGEEYII
jgi:pyruvate formate lyase activating enzyme